MDGKNGLDPPGNLALPPFSTVILSEAHRSDHGLIIRVEEPAGFFEEVSDICRIQVHRFRLDIHENGFRASPNDRARRGKKTKRSGDDAVTWANSSSRQRQPKGISSRGAADRVLRANELRQFLLQRLNFRPKHKLLGDADPLNSGPDFLLDSRILPLQVEGRNAGVVRWLVS